MGQRVPSIAHLVRRVAVLGAVLLLTVHRDEVQAATSAFPFRPGYGLGSMLPPGLIAGMKKEAAARSAIVLSEQMDAAATSLAREVKTAANPITNPLSKQQTIPTPLSHAEEAAMQQEILQFRKQALSSKMDGYRTLFANLGQQMQDLKGFGGGSAAGKGEAYSTFASGAESPVRWDASEIALLNRASDSFTVGSTFMRVDVVAQGESLSSFATSLQERMVASEGVEFAGIGMQAASDTSFGASVAARLAAAYSTKTIEKTVVLRSFATHRLVKQFKSLSIDPEKLRNAWNFFHPDRPIPDPLSERTAFRREALQMRRGGAFAKPRLGGFMRGTALDQLDTIAMVTEVFQGSGLVGFVHFIKKEQTSSFQTDISFRTELEQRMKLTEAISTMAGSTSFTMEAATHLAALASSVGLQVEFDLICLGYIPSVKSQLVESALHTFADINVNDQQSTDVGSRGMGERQSNAQAVIEGGLKAINKVVSTNPVLGIESFMDAFDDYAKAAQERPDEIGAPVGMNVREYTREEVMGILDQATRFGAR